MFSKLFGGLTGVAVDDEYITRSDTDAGSSGPSSPTAVAARSDSGHLTARASSSRSLGAALQQQQQLLLTDDEAQLDGRQSAGPSRSASQQALAESGGGGGAWAGLLGTGGLLPSLWEALVSQTQNSEEEDVWGTEAGSDDDSSFQEGAAPRPAAPSAAAARAPSPAGGSDAENVTYGDTTAPRPLEPGRQALPELSEPSGLMSEDHIRALVAEAPARYRQSRWVLRYSTLRDGISMQTLLRNAGGAAPTVLVVRDMNRCVFGAYCSEPWRLTSRYFGTGETFVFQLQPRQVVWHWWWKRMQQERNDFFLWGSSECIAVGGAGGYALLLDSELGSGVSRTSLTFGNDCLAGQEEFKVGAVELWWLQ